MNITLGSRYLAQLAARFQEPLLAVAAYNAGPHRVQRWVAERPRVDIEEFVDQIPFDETRAICQARLHELAPLPAALRRRRRPARRGEAVAAPRAAP